MLERAIDCVGDVTVEEIETENLHAQVVAGIGDPGEREPRSKRTGISDPGYNVGRLLLYCARLESGV